MMDIHGLKSINKIVSLNAVMQSFSWGVSNNFLSITILFMNNLYSTFSNFLKSQQLDYVSINNLSTIKWKIVFE